VVKTWISKRKKNEEHTYDGACGCDGAKMMMMIMVVAAVVVVVVVVVAVVVMVRKG